MAHKSFEELQLKINEAKKKIKVDGIYYHYKHPENLYKVINLAIQEASDKVCVLYQPQIYPDIIWVRDLDNWLEYVEVNRKKTPRFTLVEK